MKSIVMVICIVIGGTIAYRYWSLADDQWLRNATFLGDTDSHSIVIYLHGMDRPDISEQELKNRQTLNVIGNALSVKFYLPRSMSRCRNNDSQLCWPQDTTAELEGTLSAIMSRPNFEKQDSVEGIIGFSNGGFFTSKLIQHCLVPDAFWVISIGSSGAWRNSTKDLSNCGRLISIIGKKDKWHYSYMLDFHAYLQSAGAKVTLIEFEGGHEIPYQELEKELSLLIETNPL